MMPIDDNGKQTSTGKKPQRAGLKIYENKHGSRTSVEQN
jgi:hypothetical protein